MFIPNKCRELYCVRKGDFVLLKEVLNRGA